MYFALLEDAKCTFSEVRSRVFIYKHPSSVFPFHFTPPYINISKTFQSLLLSMKSKPLEVGQGRVQQFFTLAPAKGQPAKTAEHWVKA